MSRLMAQSRWWSAWTAALVALIAATSCGPVVIAGALAGASGGGGGGGGGATSTITFKTSLPPKPTSHAGLVLEFNVVVTSTIGDSLRLNLLNPPPGCVFTQTSPDGTTATGHVRWKLGAENTGLRRFTFRSTDNTTPSESGVNSVEVRVEGSANGGLVQIGDVTGDGIMDAVAGATVADASGKTDVGMIYVWSGSSTLQGAPTATLFVPNASALDQLGSADDQGIQLADVTGDGVLDIIAGTPNADVGGVADVGAIYVWGGGPSLKGDVAPSATLTVPGAVAGDALGGFMTGGQSIQIADMTGDGILDVIAGAAAADVGGVTDAGAIYVWNGGLTLRNFVAPLATLTVPGAVAQDHLSGFETGQGFRLADVTGDGFPDVIAGAAKADVAGVVDVGAIYVWKGGSNLRGKLDPLATLTVSGAVSGDRLGSASGEGIQFVDVTGDGVLDIVAGAEDATIGGVAAVGAIYVWKGGATLTGSLTPFATLTVPGAVAGDSLGGSAAGEQAIEFADVTGDGALDIVACAEFANIAGVNNTGAVYAWKGGSALTGSVGPLATMVVPGAGSGDWLGRTLGHTAIQFANVDDFFDHGVVDVIVGTYLADVSGVVDAGAIYVWRGGLFFSGQLSPTSTLKVGGATQDDVLGLTDGGIQLIDVTGDGVLDVVSGSTGADVSGVVDAGALYVWKGGSLSGASDPFATLTVPGAKTNDRLGAGGVQFADVAGDGVVDVIAGAELADVAGVADAGAIYVWQGGVALNGSLSPTATLTIPGAHVSDLLPDASGQGLQFGDVTGDGAPDVVACASSADVSFTNVGAIYIWSGGSTLNGSPVPFASLTVPGAIAGDQLGIASGQGFFLSDLDNDSVLDVVGVGQFADSPLGIVDVGSIYVWSGGSGLSVALPSTFAVPDAVASDQLGR